MWKVRRNSVINIRKGLEICVPHQYLEDPHPLAGCVLVGKCGDGKTSEENDFMAHQRGCTRTPGPGAPAKAVIPLPRDFNQPVLSMGSSVVTSVE